MIPVPTGVRVWLATGGTDTAHVRSPPCCRLTRQHGGKDLAGRHLKPAHKAHQQADARHQGHQEDERRMADHDFLAAIQHLMSSLGSFAMKEKGIASATKRRAY